MVRRDFGCPRAVRAAAFIAAASIFTLVSPLSKSAVLTTPTEGTPDIIPGAGESPTAPTAHITEREQLIIVGSSTVEAYARAAVEALQRDYLLPDPIIEVRGTTDGIKRFCAGIGPKYPDIVAASRIMQKGEFDTCLENGVLDLIEVKIGQTAFVVLTKKGDPVFDITPRMIYLALAKDVPGEGEFEPNPFITWKQIEKAAPDLPVNVIIPTTESGLRTLFDANFMQGGCRHLKEIDAIFSASERVPKCVTLREDGHVTEINESKVDDYYGQLLVAALLKAPAGTLGVAALPTYLANQDKFDVLPVAGVLPLHENIGDYTYLMTSDLRFYFKRAHMRNNEGKGVVRGIREFMAEITKEDAMGEGGYFEQLGVVALPEDTRDQMRRNVARLTRFKR
jgi:phosphate transport system substrate-binding protein